MTPLDSSSPAMTAFVPVERHVAADAVKLATLPEHHRFHFLDALRGVAAILIISRHAPNAFGHSLIFHNDFMAVDFFFCLSGFVIAFSYEKRLASSLSFAAFAVTRMIRFLPVAVLATLLGFIGLFVSHHVQGYAAIPISRGTALANFLLGSFVLPHFSWSGKNVILFPLDSVMWTLLVEIIANFFYAILVRFRIAHNWVVLVLSIASLLLLIAECRLHGDLDYGYSQASFSLGLARVGFSFFAGVLIYRFHTHRALIKFQGQRAILAALSITAIFVFTLCNPMQISHTRNAELITACLVFPLVIHFGARLAVPLPWVTMCAFLGTVSYPIYLLHPPLLWFLTRTSYLQFARGHTLIATLVMVSYISLLILLAWLCAAFFDTPLRKMLTNTYRTFWTKQLVM